MNQNHEALVMKMANLTETTPDHLWAMLIRQAGIQAVISGITSAALVLFLWLIFKALKRKKEWDLYLSDEGALLLWIVYIFFSAAVSIFIIGNLYEMLLCLMSPEYWALKQVLKW